MENYNFDNIRPYSDDEVNKVLKKITKDKEFIYILNKIYPESKVHEVLDKLQYVNSIKDFQINFVWQYANFIIKGTIEEFTYDGLGNIHSDKNHLFISNHRDIILDSALLNAILYNNDISTTEIAIGSNLLIFPWIADLVRLNKSFIVQRNLKGKEMFKASKQLSAYIRYKLTEKKTSIWIAQKEGRTKDGNDRTQIGLLKMFNFSGKGDFIEDFLEMNIIPVSISYEYEPCDKTKTTEMYVVKSGKKYNKTTADDLKSMGRGIANKKGRVHVSFGQVISEQLKEFAKIKNINQRYESLAKLIDERIFEGYKLTEFNYIAYDLLYKTNKFSKYYSADKKQLFIDHKENMLERIEGNKNQLNQIFFEIYANPVSNKYKIYNYQ